ncbi:MAG: hypothetical protein R3A46_14080 [Thermomicrobiales bacterium]
MAMNRDRDNVGRLAAAAFASTDQAEAALSALMESGFTEEQTGVIASTNESHLLENWIPQAEDASSESSGSHVAIGGVLGGILGGAVALAVPGIGWAAGAGIIATTIAGGSFGAGIVGPLLDLEVEEDRAIYLDERLRAGDIIVTVHDDDRSDEAQDILQTYGGKTAGTSGD